MIHLLLIGAAFTDADGSAIDWNLQGQLKVGEKLPPLNREGDSGQG